MSIRIKDINNKKKVSKTVNKLKPAGLEFLNKDIKLFGSKFNDKKKEDFYSELGILLSSGVDIKTALEIIVNEQKESFSRNLLEDVYQNVIKGKSLSDSLALSYIFTPYEINSIKIGEESGRINDVFIELTNFYNKKISQKRQLVNAFTYPVIILITAIAAVYFMLNFMVPMFVDIFARFQGKLPKLTVAIINLSNFFSRYFWLFLVIIIVSYIFSRVNRKKNWYRSLHSKFLLSLPFIGIIVKLIYLERFFQSMTLLISSKTPLLKSIRMVRNMIGFYPFEKALEKIEDDILHGKLLYDSLSAFNIFDKKIISLIKVGEETNNLQYIFERLNKQQSDELEFKIGMISSFMEPFIIIFVGILVGIILIAMYLPMFQMSTSVM